MSYLKYNLNSLRCCNPAVLLMDTPFDYSAFTQSSYTKLYLQYVFPPLLP